MRRGSAAARARKRARRAGRERGFVIVWMAIVLVLLIAIAGLAVDLVHAYAEAQHLQNAVDAAALGGAVELPLGNGTDTSAATNDVQKLLAQNGYPDGGDNTITMNKQDAAIKNQMDVQETHRFDTLFARIFGFDSITVKRTAYGQYDPPIAMGSATNNLGDVPMCPDQDLTAAPPWLPISHCVAIPTAAAQNLWLQIQGPDTAKQSGNPYTTMNCGSVASWSTGADNCDPASLVNTENTPGNSEDFAVGLGGNTGTLSLSIYDAGFVATRPDCNFAAGFPENLWATGTPAQKVVDALANGASKQQYCTGDSVINKYDGTSPTADGTPFGKPIDLMTTSYTLLAPSVDGAPRKQACPTLTVPPYASPNDAFATSDAQYWHQWTTLCNYSISPAEAAAITPTNEFEVEVSSPSGRGTNQFSLVAELNGGPASQLSMFTRQRLPISAVSPAPDVNGNVAAPTFYLARVLPSTQDRYIVISFFDLGDSTMGASTGTLSLSYTGLNSNDFTGFTDCEFTSPPASDVPTRVMMPPYDFDLAGCSLHYDTRKPPGGSSYPADWNGRWVAWKIRIPAATSSGGGWNCDPSDFQNCWMQLKVTPDSGSLSDATTWNAQILGSPARLVKGP